MKIKLKVNRDNQQIGDICVAGTDEPFAQIQPCGTNRNPDSKLRDARANFVVQAVNEREDLLVIADAYKKLRDFYFDDLAKNNKGFIGPLFIQDFGAMNEAYLASEKADVALKNLEKGRKP